MKLEKLNERVPYQSWQKMRYRRLLDLESGALIAVPLDHGFTLPPIQGVNRLSKTVDSVSKDFLKRMYHSGFKEQP
ncbi:MAG: hypothetical protein D6732_16975 [Methanobacteriota archaeon]|nr:MAG: hypothetical protein D6732_16975 [Euryarchaeota archaeon]